MNDWPWVIASYGLTWLVLGCYALHMHRDHERARREFADAVERSGAPSEVES